jgi:hypothetical protein
VYEPKENIGGSMDGEKGGGGMQMPIELDLDDEDDESIDRALNFAPERDLGLPFVFAIPSI